jgi:hypothetical protein
MVLAQLSNPYQSRRYPCCRSRRFDVPGQAFWDAATRHARTPDDLAALAYTAFRRLRKRQC